MHRSTYIRKPPTYTPRELEAIRHAEHVLLRLHHTGVGWTEGRVCPGEHETLAQCLRRVQADIHLMREAHPELQRVALYVEGEHPLHGTMMAAVPRDMVPVEIERLTADRHYPVPTSARRHT